VWPSAGQTQVVDATVPDTGPVVLAPRDAATPDVRDVTPTIPVDAALAPTDDATAAVVVVPPPPPPPPPPPRPLPPVDAGPPDAGPPDAGPPDAGPSDAGPSDAGPSDAAVGDAGLGGDAGVGGHATAPHGTPARRSTGSLARVTLGLFLILALTILGGHPALRSLEKRTGIAMVTGSGLPFLLLGMVARRPEVGILDDAMLHDLRPLLEFGLGWIGFRVGTDFDVREMDRWPEGTARVMITESACAFLVVGVVSGLVMKLGLHPHNVARNALILGACAAVSAPTGARALEHMGILPAESSKGLRRVASLDDIMALFCLALVTCAYRPVQGGTWLLPPLGWLFVQIGMGVVLGAVLVAAVRIARNANEDLALTLGGVAFAAGMAGYVGFSPLVVGCVAGVVVTNLPASALAASALVSRARLRELERTLYMAFFVVVGALWDPRHRAGWILLPVFVIARLLGKLLGLRAAGSEEATHGAETTPGATASPPPSSARLLRTWVALMPTSAVSIAVVVSAHTAYRTILPGVLETVVIMGALMSELIFRGGVRLLGGRLRDDDTGLGALAMQHDDAFAPVPTRPSSPPPAPVAPTPAAPVSPVTPPPAPPSPGETP